MELALFFIHNHLIDYDIASMDLVFSFNFRNCSIILNPIYFNLEVPSYIAQVPRPPLNLVSEPWKMIKIIPFKFRTYILIKKERYNEIDILDIVNILTYDLYKSNILIHIWNEIYHE